MSWFVKFLEFCANIKHLNVVLYVLSDEARDILKARRDYVLERYDRESRLKN